MVSSFPGSWWTSSFADPSPNLLRCSNFWRLSAIQGPWSRTFSDLDRGLNGGVGLALFLPGPLFQTPNFTSPNPRWQRWGRDPLHEQTGWAGGCWGLHWEQHFVSSVPASSIEQGTFSSLWCPGCADTFSKSCLWTRFSVSSLGHPTWVLGPFPVPSPLPKVLRRQNPGFLKSNFKAVSVHVASIFSLIVSVSRSQCHIWFWTCSRLIQL